MISRREVVTAGVLGSLTGAAGTAEAAAQNDQDAAALRSGMNSIVEQMSRMNTTLDYGQRGPGLVSGFLGEIRNRFTTHIRAAGKFPEFMEIGLDVFYDVYDWHIRYGQPIQITRISEQRFAIQWMFTQLILRWEQDPRYLGTPYDRG
jgi:hypothetical protein